MSGLSEEAKRELLVMAGSESLRRDFAALRRNAAARAPKSVDEFVQFLRLANSIGFARLRPRPVDGGRCLI